MSYRDRLASGESVDLRPKPAVRVNAKYGKLWRSSRTVEASLLSMLLTANTSASGWTHRPLRLSGARITGTLDLESATLTRPLYLEDCFLEDSITLNDADAITIRLTGCHLPGMLCSGLHTRGDLRLNDGFTAIGNIDLHGARIGGKLDCDGGTFINPHGTALTAHSLKVEGDMWCTDGFRVTGEVDLLGAYIGGQFDCSGGIFSNKNGKSLKASRLTVSGSIYCREGFTATGEVDLSGARIDGQLSCVGGTINNENQTALNGDSMSVGGSVLCRDGFTATGEVNLRSAHIGGQLDCGGGIFSNETQTALNAESATIDGSVFFRGGFTATGEVNLRSAHIGGQLSCVQGTFSNENDVALRLYRTEVAKDVVFGPRSLTGMLNLSFAKIGSWRDAETTWPDKGKLRLNGLSYSFIEAQPPVSARRRLQWLQHNAEGYLPQPYDQLASAYTAQGDDSAARTVQISAQWRRRAALAAAKGWRQRALWPFRMFWSVILWATIGYGYRPWQIVAPIGVLYGFGCWWFNHAVGHGEMVRMKGLDPHVQFNGARYTADLLVPGASLGERVHFIAVGQAAWWATGYTLAGWALAAMLIAGLTGVFKRQ